MQLDLITVRTRQVNTITGMLLLSGVIFTAEVTDNIIVHKVLINTLSPIAFFLMILGVYYKDFKYFNSIKVMGYYSYNWYLWHPVISVYLLQFYEPTITTLIVYLVLSFSISIIATRYIEEPFLRLRRKLNF